MKILQHVSVFQLALLLLGSIVSVGVHPASAGETLREQAIQKVRSRALSRALRITAMTAYDRGSLSSQDTTLDTSQGTCSGDEDEPFFDSLLGITIRNGGLVPVQVRKIAYVVFAGNADGSRFRARRYSPFGGNEIAPDTEEQITALFLDTEGDRKYFAGAEEPIPVDLGFRTVKVRVIGIDFTHRRFRIKKRVTFSFGNPDRCS